jgi:hypothetical protein
MHLHNCFRAQILPTLHVGEHPDFDPVEIFSL